MNILYRRRLNSVYKRYSLHGVLRAVEYPGRDLSEMHRLYIIDGIVECIYTPISGWGVHRIKP